jgi:heat shock protein HslJ
MRLGSGRVHGADGCNRYSAPYSTSFDGVVMATLDAESQELANTEWTVIAYNAGTNAVVGVLAETHLSIRFSADAKMSGSAGCNDYTGSYSFSGQNLTIGGTAATRRTCAQPEGVMKQERLFLKALSMVAFARVDGDRLELHLRDGGLAAKAVRSAGPRAVRGDPAAMEADFVSAEPA